MKNTLRIVISSSLIWSAQLVVTMQRIMIILNIMMIGIFIKNHEDYDCWCSPSFFALAHSNPFACQVRSCISWPVAVFFQGPIGHQLPKIVGLKQGENSKERLGYRGLEARLQGPGEAVGLHQWSSLSLYCYDHHYSDIIINMVVPWNRATSI